MTTPAHGLLVLGQEREALDRARRYMKVDPFYRGRGMTEREAAVAALALRAFTCPAETDAKIAQLERESVPPDNWAECDGETCGLGGTWGAGANPPLHLMRYVDRDAYLTHAPLNDAAWRQVRELWDAARRSKDGAPPE